MNCKHCGRLARFPGEQCASHCPPDVICKHAECGQMLVSHRDHDEACPGNSVGLRWHPTNRFEAEAPPEWRDLGADMRLEAGDLMLRYTNASSRGWHEIPAHFIGMLVASFDRRAFQFRRRVQPAVAPTCDEDCTRCSGEYCEQHGVSPCECDVIDRHQKAQGEHFGQTCVCEEHEYPYGVDPSGEAPEPMCVWCERLRVEKLEAALQAMLAAVQSDGRDVKFGEMTILESAIKVGEAALGGRIWTKRTSAIITG